MITFISNENFNDVSEYYFTSQIYDDKECMFSKDEHGNIVFNTNFAACPCIYYYKNDNLFCYSFFIEDVIEFLGSHGIDVEYSEENVPKFKTSIKRRYFFKAVKSIDKWKKVVLNSKGEFIKTEYDFKPFQIPLIDAYDNLKQLLLKYKRAINAAIDDNRFMPTITGGLDTRTFIALYKDRIKDLPGKYYLKAIKQDGRGLVDLGAADVECAERVASKFGFNTREEDLFGNITISGLLNENSRGFYGDVNDEDYVWRGIQHSYSRQSTYNSKLLPYIDELYLSIRNELKGTTRCLLALILIPDLLDYPLIGTNGRFIKCGNKSYSFWDFEKDEIERAKEIIAHWGKEKCDNILKDQ